MDYLSLLRNFIFRRSKHILGVVIIFECLDDGHCVVCVETIYLNQALISASIIIYLRITLT